MDDKLKVVSLFTGIGAWEKALDNVGIEYDLKHFCEKDKWATTAYCAIHNEDESKNLGDITVINPNGVEDFDVLFYSPPCFKPGTLITTKDGLVPIENIKIGDLVLTHNNRFREVINTMTKYSKSINELSVRGSPSTSVTDEHPYYVREMKTIKDESGRIKRMVSEPKWKAVKDLNEDDFIGFPINCESEAPKGFNILSLWVLATLSANSDSKIPNFVLNLPRKYLKDFFDVFLSHKVKNQDRNDSIIKIEVKNETLAYQVGQIIMKVYGVHYTLDRLDDIWIVKYDMNGEIDIFANMDKTIWQPFINRVHLNSYNDYVYNLEVEEDNSYVANNAIVHNCQAFSYAGKQMGFEDERGILFFDALKIIRAKKPKIAFMENVKGLVGKKFKKEFESMLDALEKIGYNNYYKVLNASDYGIPQNRERVFIISILKEYDDGSFEFPKAFKSNLRLKHMLEDVVDEKYYISSERVEKLIEELKVKNQEISYCIDANYHKGTTPEDFLKKSRRQLVCIPCLTPDRLKRRQQGRRFKEDGEDMFTITSQDRHGVMLNEADDTDKIIQLNNPKHSAQRIYDKKGIAPTISAGNRGGGKEPCKILCEERTDEGLRFFKNNICGTIRSIDAGGDKRIIERNDIDEDECELKFVGGIGEKDWAKDGKKFSRNYPQGNRVYDSDGLACSQTSQGGGIGSFTGLYLERKNDIDSKDYYSLLVICDCDGVYISNAQSVKCPYCNKIESNCVAYLTKDIHDKIITDYIIDENIETNNETNKLIIKLRLEGGMWDKVTEDIKRVYGIEGICPTITTCQGGHRQPKVLNQPEYRIRKLTPKECFRLMAFTDEDYEKARQALMDKYYNGNDRSASQMYKMAGNSIVVKVIEEIFKNIDFDKFK